MDGRIALATSMSVSAIMVLYGIINVSPITSTIALISVLCIAIMLSDRNYAVDPRIAVISSVTIVIASLLVQFYPYVPGTVSRTEWGHVIGIFYWIAAYPVSFLMIQVVVIKANARYNFPLLSGLPVFLTGAQVVIGWVVVSLFCNSEINTEFTGVELVTSLFVGLILSVFCALILWKLIRRKHFVLNCDTCGVKL
jgi:hypothetical protein